MKKTLVAIAAVAVTTGAMAEATITGLFDLAVNSGSSTTLLGSGPNGGSEVTVGISEDLGNGLTGTAALTVIGAVTSMGNSNVTSGFAMYNSYVGIALADVGSVKLGSQWNPIFLTATIGEITGRWNSASLANTAELQNTNSITYTSPNISGFTLSYQTQLTNSADTTTSTSTSYNAQNFNSTGGHATAYSLEYANGGLKAGYANSKDDNWAYGGDTTTSTVIAASYDFGIAKLHYAHLVTDEATSGTDVTANSYGVSVPFGAFVLGAQASKNDASTVKTTNSYIANYSMSKHTTVYYSNNNANSVVTNQLGIKMAF